MLNKEEILSQSREHLADVRARLNAGQKELRESLKRSNERFSSLSYADQMVESIVMANGKKRIEEFQHLKGSPYFVRCDILFQNEQKEDSIYFAKFGFDQEAIYSWVAPASVMRFERPGDVSYRRPDGMIQRAKLLRKDQYMIVDGKIKFLSSESVGVSRELIYEEYFSTQKSGFMLPEIVAQMEKAQDQVIRAHHVGPFLISGPAGSGKTTLALHRVAYLAQSPDLAKIFPSKSIVVFVQDWRTKEYFSQLLPELGINDVEITTFPEWALQILDIGGMFSDGYGDSESERDHYEYQKLKALEFIGERKYSKIGAPALLEKAYEKIFDGNQKILFQRQMRDKVFDRIDLTLLLKIFFQSNEKLSIIKDYYVEQKNGKAKKKRGAVSLEYSLAVIDEFQNYLPDQLKLIKTCINQKSQSIVYVGDMAQQVKLGTMRQWEDIGEKMERERKVVLEKVYRNTKNILLFIRKLGYEIEIPDQIKMGVEVGEYILETKEQEIKKIKQIIEKENFSSLGILSKENEYLTEFKGAFGENNKIHIMTMSEAQGVEFDIVILVGIGRGIFSVENDIQGELAQEKRRINRDLLYIALTRAISQLHIMGRKKLELDLFS